MRRAWQLAGVALISALLGCAPSWDRNVVLIVIDTLRVDGLPLYGGDEAHAPFLASLAPEALVFEQAWSASSWTAPATASIFTSTYPNEHGVVMGLRVYRHHKGDAPAIQLNRIPQQMETIPAFMRSQGYRTFGVSGNPNIGDPMGFTRGFDRFEMVDYRDDRDGRRLVSQLLEWRAEIEASEPFFLYLHFMDPHAPYHRHAEWVPESAPPPPAKRLADRVAYDSEVRLVDEEIRRLYRDLRLDDALLIVTSDHGQEFGEHGDFGHGFQLYSELTQIPLLVRHPEGPSGRVAAGVSNLDVLPTLRALLGAPPGSQDRGLPLLGPDAPGDAARSFFSMRSRARSQREKRAVVRGNRKLIVSEPEGQAELYDLGSDPREQNNLAAHHPAEVEELRALLEEQARWGSPSRYESADPVRASSELIERLERLGYIEEQEP